jgi:enamine deaminase RidA (YjgF/YER057c/UK114 family)
MTNTTDPVAALRATLEARGLALPPAPVPKGNYSPWIRSGRYLILAGHTPLTGGEAVFTGTVGADLTPEQGQQAAQLCALNMLATVADACGPDLDRVRMLRLAGYVRCVDDFDRHPFVLEGASDMFRLAFGDRGTHARVAIGVNSLPKQVPVELEAQFEIGD